MKQIAALVFSKEVDSSYALAGFETTERRANSAFEELEALAKKGAVAIESGTVVVNDMGMVKLKKTSDRTAKSGAGWGAFWGLLVGLIFAGPLVGVLGGLGLGALLGGKAHKGIDRDFMKEIGKGIKPGDAALFLLIDGDDEATLKQLQAYDAKFYTTTLTDDVHEALEKATEHEEILAALKEEPDQE